MTASTKLVEPHTQSIPISHHGRHEEIRYIISSLLPQFDKIIQSYVLFNALFLTLGGIEIILIIFFFTFLAKSAILAFSLALLFLTFFSYFIFRLYLQTKKPEQFEGFKQHYLAACKAVLGYREGIPEHHIALAEACAKLSNALKGKEQGLYRPPNWLNILRPYLEKFSLWRHWRDIHRMRELMLLHAVEENIKLVKCGPTSVETHASLANGYTMLSALYDIPRESLEEEWVPSERMAHLFEQKFQSAVKRAVEEFTIVSEFAPDDAWAHAQLARSYHILNMPLKEIHEYETLLQLDPEETEILSKLGELYFRQGFNAKGLHIYAQLMHIAPAKAEALIAFYGA